MTAASCGCSTANSAMAPPGGCRQRSASISITANPTPRPQASGRLGTSAAQATPTRYDSALPASTGHGCARGLEGKEMMSTALDPNDAIIHGIGEAAPNQWAKTATAATLRTMPETMRRRSRWLMRTRAGMKRRSHARARRVNGPGASASWGPGLGLGVVSKDMKTRQAPARPERWSVPGQKAANYPRGTSAMGTHGYCTMHAFARTAKEIAHSPYIEWPGLFAWIATTCLTVSPYYPSICSPSSCSPPSPDDLRRPVREG